MTFETQVLCCKGAVAEDQKAIVGAIDGESSFGEDRQVDGVEPVQKAPVDRVDGTVCVGNDRTAPDVFSAREFGRTHDGPKRFGVEALDPAKRRWTAERGHRAANEPLAGVTFDRHDVPAVVSVRHDLRGAACRIEATHCRFLPPVSTALDRPGRIGPVARLRAHAVEW